MLLKKQQKRKVSFVMRYMANTRLPLILKRELLPAVFQEGH